MYTTTRPARCCVIKAETSFLIYKYVWGSGPLRIKLRQNRSLPADVSPVVNIRNEELCMITRALFLNYIETMALFFFLK